MRPSDSISLAIRFLPYRLMALFRPAIAMLLSGLALLGTARALPGDLDPLNAPISGIVIATAIQPDGKIILVGSFKSVLGVPRNYIVRLNVDGTLDLDFNPKPNSVVESVLVQADGKVLIAGSFTALQPNGAASATTRNRIARLNADGTLDTGFDPNPNSFVDCLALQADGMVLVGGWFTTLQPNGAASATTRNRIARLNADGTLDTGFNPNSNGWVKSVAVQADGKVLIGGEFTTLQPNGPASATTRNYIARVNADGTLDTDFNPNAGYDVLSVAVQADGKVLIGGDFTSLQPNGAASATARNRIARLNADGTLDTGFNPNANNSVISMAVQGDGKVLIGGKFTTLQPNGAASATTRSRIARLNADGTVDMGFDPNPNNWVESLALQADGKVLIGGGFTALQPNGAASATTRSCFARLINDSATQTLAAATGAQITWTRGGSAPEVSQVTFELSTDDGNSYTALPGTATRVGTTANWQLTGLSLPTSGHLRARGRTTGGLQNGSSGLIEQVLNYSLSDTEIAVTESAIIVADGGSYSFGSTVVGTPLTKTFTVTNGGTAPLNLSALSAPAGFTISENFASSTVAAGGGTTTFQITMNAGATATPVGILSFTNNDSDENPYEFTIGGTVLEPAPEIVVTESAANVADGSSLNFGSTHLGTPPTKTFTVTNSGTAPLNLSDLTVPSGFTITQDFASGTVAAGGGSTTFQITMNADSVGTPNGMLSITNDDADENPYNFTISGAVRDLISGDLDSLNVSLPGSYSHDVRATAVQPDGKIILAGNFTSVSGVQRNRIARLNVDGTLDTGFNPNANNDVYSVAVQADGKLLIGGSFATLQPNGAASATTRNRIARLNADGTLDTSFNPNANGSVYSMVLQADGRVLIGGSFSTLQPNGAASPTTRSRIARLNADGTLDTGFNPNVSENVSGNVYSMVIQADGKVLIGGSFTTLQPNGAASPTTRNRIARLNADGTLDTVFNPNASWEILSVALQGDGKVLIGGSFATLQPNGAASATTRNCVARLNADGTLDTSFNPNANGSVYSMVLQADGRVLIGGSFSTLQPNGAAIPTTRNRIARLNADGTLDTGFNPNASNTVYCVTVQADGKVLIGGGFTTLQPNGVASATSRVGFARLLNDPATQTLAAVSTTQVTWTRSGTAPEVSQVAFDFSTNGGTSYTPLPGTATRVGTTSNWQLSGLSLTSNGLLRARGRTSGGYFNGSSGLIEQVINYAPEIAITESAADVADGDSFNFGTTLVGTPVTKTFTVTNSGTAPLTLSALTVPSGFTIAQNFASSTVAAGGGTTTFQITLSAGATAAPSGTLSFTNNDSDENPYNFTISGTVTAPEIAVSGNSVNIVDGDTTPSLTDHTDFSSAFTSGGTVTRTFTINNSGSAALNLTGSPKVAISGTHALDFTVTLQPTSPVPETTGTTTFQVTFDPSATGLRTAILSIANDDPNENPFNFSIQGTGIAPEIAVSGNAVNIVNGDNTPSATDHTDFGSINITGMTVTRTFTISNSGNGPLSLTGNPRVAVSGANVADFTVTVQPSTPVAATSGTTIFQVTFDPSGAGLRSATLAIANDDSDENPYNFIIKGNGFSIPEIAISGNSVDIADGDTTPSLTDHTDFGSSDVSGGTVTRSFIISNSGSGDLSLTGSPRVAISGTHAADFTVSVLPSSPIAAATGSTTFQVTFDPSAAGVRSAALSIANDDANENPFNFNIQGTGNTPEMAVIGNSANIVDGDTTPIPTDHTDFGSIAANGGTVTRTFTIINSGSAALILSGTPKVVISGTHAADFTVSVQPSSPVAATSGNTTFQVIFDPSATGLRTATLTIANDDPDENPFNFNIQGTGIAPEIAVIGNSVNIVNGDTTPSVTDHTDCGSINILSSTVTRTFTISNTGNGPLILTGTQKVAVSGTHAADFTVALQPVSPVAATSGTTTFQVTFDPSAVGLRSATLSIVNDDPDENPFNFNISGSGFSTPDTTLPIVAITSPASNGTTVATSSLTVSGTASDNIGVVSVSVRINGGTWNSASGTTSWSRLVTLVAGNNTIEVQSQDAAGNTSSMAVRTLNHINSGPPPVIVQEPGWRYASTGEMVEFEVIATGDNLSYQWFSGAAGVTTMPIAGADGAVLKIRAATDGLYWVRVSNPAGSVDSTPADLLIYSMPAGETWQASTPVVTSSLWSVEWLGNQFVAVGDAGVILTSPTGGDWTQRTSNTTQQLESVAWNGRMLVAVGAGGTIVTSPDGVSWTVRSNSGNELNAVLWNGTHFLATGPPGTMRRSADGIAWQNVTSNNPDGYNLRYLNGVHVLVGPETLQTSGDGLAWTSRINSAGMFFDDVTTNGLTWLATGSDGKVRTSSNSGATWTAAQTVATTWLRGVASDGAGFVAVGHEGVIYTSPNGTSWSARSSGVSGILHSIVWNGRWYVAVGENGVIVRSGGEWQGYATTNYAQWAASRGLHGALSNPAGDWDSDGVTNVVEFMGGTSPSDPRDIWKPTPEIYTEGGQKRVRMVFPRTLQSAALSLVMEKSINGTSWTPVNLTQSPDGTGFTNRYSWSSPLSIEGPRMLFRFRYPTAF